MCQFNSIKKSSCFQFFAFVQSNVDTLPINNPNDRS